MLQSGQKLKDAVCPAGEAGALLKDLAGAIHSLRKSLASGPAALEAAKRSLAALQSAVALLGKSGIAADSEAAELGAALVSRLRPLVDA